MYKEYKYVFLSHNQIYYKITGFIWEIRIFCFYNFITLQ